MLGWLPLLVSAPTLQVQSQVVQGIKVQYVRISMQRYRAKVAFGQGRWGRVESLEAMARCEGAAAAINGAFFEAYTDEPIRNVDQSIISNGELVHLGRIGSVIGFAEDGTARIDTPRWRLSGTLDGKGGGLGWYGVWTNRKPSQTTATIYTPFWGTQTNLADGTQVVVSNGTVRAISTGNQVIPADGFVLVLRGAELSQARRFRIGQRVAYRAELVSGDAAFWSSAREAVGAGPTVLRDGAIQFDPATEGFSSPKILSQKAARSAVGIAANGDVILAVTTATVSELGGVMRAIGARHAMNLDGGASSGLVVGGKTVRKTGRQIATSLVFVPR